MFNGIRSNYPQDKLSYDTLSYDILSQGTNYPTDILSRVHIIQVTDYPKWHNIPLTDYPMTDYPMTYYPMTDYPVTTYPMAYYPNTYYPMIMWIFHRKLHCF